ncbi:MAG TPA: hypothetical protein VF678_05710 [bacterium]
MKRALFVALSALLAFTGCSKDDGGSKHAGELVIRCASLSATDTGSCDPHAPASVAAAFAPDTIVTAGPEIGLNEDLLVSLMVENTGDIEKDVIVVTGVNDHCFLSNGTSSWSWRALAVGKEAANTTEDRGTNIGNCFAGSAGPRQAWSILFDTEEHARLLFPSDPEDIADWHVGPDDPSVTPYILDWARIDFTLVAE